MSIGTVISMRRHDFCLKSPRNALLLVVVVVAATAAAIVVVVGYALANIKHFGILIKFCVKYHISFNI